MVNSKFRSQLLETRLESRDCQLALAASAAEMGFWTLEPTTGELRWSTRCQALMDAAADAPAALDSLIACIHPEEQTLVRRAFAQALHLKREFSVDFRVIGNSGATRQMRCIGRPITSALSPDQPALTGLLQALPDADSNTPDSSRIGAAVHRVESLREMERNSLIGRLNAEVLPCLLQLQLRIDCLLEAHRLPAELHDELVALSGEAGCGADALRSAVFEVRPPGVAELGFAGALERYASEQAATAGIELTLTLPEDTLPLGDTTLESLYVVARTGIDNVVRHAQARHMHVIVVHNTEEISLKIVDDGVGIRNADLMKDSAFSLFASSERIANSGGELRVSGTANQGTTLEVSFALRRKTRPLRRKVTPLQVA